MIGIYYYTALEPSTLSINSILINFRPKRSRAKIPAILQRKRKKQTAIANNDHTNYQSKKTLLESLPTIRCNKNDDEKVVKRIILIKPINQASILKPTLPSIPPANDVHVEAPDQQNGQEEEEEEEKEEIEEKKVIIEPTESKYTPTKRDVFECDSCDESFTNRSSLIIHKTEKSIVRTRAALREPVVKYACDICKRVFVSKGTFARHHKNCGALGLESLPTNTRPQRTRRTAQIKRNKENENEEEGPAACQKCNKVFKKDKYLKVHMTTAHGEHIICQVCDTRLDTIPLLKAHMNEMHSSDFTEYCQICNKGFYLRRSLKVHLAAHTRDDKPCICEICHQSFRHEVYLRKHVQLVHVELKGRKRYICNECGYETHYKTCFREHMYKHTGEDQVECDICGKHMRKSYMKLHTRIHTGEKPEICEYCGKGFSARKYLTKHRVTHTGEKPYQCQICGKRYTQRGTLTLHFKRHHPQEISCLGRKGPGRKVPRKEENVQELTEECKEVRLEYQEALEEEEKQEPVDEEEYEHEYVDEVIEEEDVEQKALIGNNGQEYNEQEVLAENVELQYVDENEQELMNEEYEQEYLVNDEEFDEKNVKNIEIADDGTVLMVIKDENEEVTEGEIVEHLGHVGMEYFEEEVEKEVVDDVTMEILEEDLQSDAEETQIVEFAEVT